jgi:hypothetical protein
LHARAKRLKQPVMEAWKSKVVPVGVLIVVVGGVAMLIGRSASSKRVPELTSSAQKGAPGNPSAWSNMPAGADDQNVPQHFDLKELPEFKAGVGLRPMDKEVFERLADPKLQRTDLLDLFPDRPYKVRVVGSVQERRYGMVMIDADRNGKWDEKWVLKGDQVLRTVMAEDEPPIEFNLAHGRWQAH